MQVMPGVSLRARWDATLVCLIEKNIIRRSCKEGGDLEMHEGELRTRKVC